MKHFLTDLNRRDTRMSTLLDNSGMAKTEIALFRDQRVLNDFVMRLCPQMWEWLQASVGFKTAHIVVEVYGLYGDERRWPNAIAPDLALTTKHATALYHWALKQLRDPDRFAELRDIVISAAHKVLATQQLDKAKIDR